MNKKISRFIFIGIVLAFTANIAQAKDYKDAFDRIMDTRTIRCAYALRPPTISKDVNTNKMNGIGVDLMEEVGRRLNLKIDWAEEVGFGTIIESVKTRRVDMGCGIYWSNAARAPHIGFTKPIYFETLYVYSRKDDPRKFKSFEQLNDPKYSFSSIDGGTPIILQQQLLPLSTQKTLPELSDLSETFMDLITKKVDFVIQPEITTVNFEKVRPNLIKKLFDTPIAYYPATMLLPIEDIRLKSMLDIVLTEIEYDGTLEKILKKYKAEKIMKRNPIPQDF